MKYKKLKLFICTFLLTFLCLSFLTNIVEAKQSRISEDQRHMSHYTLSSTVKFGTKNFSLKYEQNGNTNWSSPIRTGMATWNAEGANIKIGASDRKIVSKNYGTASWAGSVDSKYLITLNDAAVTNNTQRAEVVAHELGHALGLGHVSCTSELMRSVGLRGTYSLYAGDLAGYHKIW